MTKSNVSAMIFLYQKFFSDNEKKLVSIIVVFECDESKYSSIFLAVFKNAKIRRKWRAIILKTCTFQPPMKGLLGARRFVPDNFVFGVLDY